MNIEIGCVLNTVNALIYLKTNSNELDKSLYEILLHKIMGSKINYLHVFTWCPS
jgi:hypothetical protein